MGAYSEQEQRPSRRAESPEDEDDCVTCFCSCLTTLVSVSIFGAFLMLIVSARDPPQYYVTIAIATASGLDYNSTAAGPVAALDPAFNLTVRIASKSRDQACLNPTTSVHVSYMGVQLAAERVRPGLCAAPWKSKDQPVVARGKAVAMSGFLLDTLAEDVRNGEAVFVVRLMSPHGDYWEVLKCRDRIGDAAALEVPCSKSWVDANKAVPNPIQVPGGPLVADAHGSQ